MCGLMAGRLHGLTILGVQAVQGAGLVLRQACKESRCCADVLRQQMILDVRTAAPGVLASSATDRSLHGFGRGGCKEQASLQSWQVGC